MNGKIPHLVQYQGSKRNLAQTILQYLPNKFDRLIEPFAGMAAVSIATAIYSKTNKYIINDLNKPLVELLDMTINNPKKLYELYENVWAKQFTYFEHTNHYYEVRELFNEGEKTPENMLYLLARCVKGSVRYSRDGKFNQSPDKRRHGTKPSNIMKNAYDISKLLNGKVSFFAKDYNEILKMATQSDIVYMDPPYQGVSNVSDQRYLSGIMHEEFSQAIVELDKRKVPYIISYDGKCGNKEYGSDLPEILNCTKLLLNAGRSSQATLLGKNKTTYEALYVSNQLMINYDSVPKQLSFMENAI